MGDYYRIGGQRIPLPFVFLPEFAFSLLLCYICRWNGVLTL